LRNKNGQSIGNGAMSRLRAQLKSVARLLMRTMVRLRLLWVFSTDARVLEKFVGAPPGKKKRLCIFASFSRHSRLEDYVFNNLASLQKQGFAIVFVTTSEKMQADDLARLKALCSHVLRRANTGYDFGSWKAGLLSADIDYRDYDQLLLTNDSYYGPLYPWKQVLAKAKTDLYGITDSYGIAYHLMSYFVLYNRKALHSAEFLKYWSGVRMIPTLLKTLIIYAYEVDMCQKFQRRGFTVSAYCSERELFDALPKHQHLFNKTIIVHRFWRELIETLRCPILKVDVFWRVLPGDSSWRGVIEKTGYPVRLIDAHQKNLSRS
jgi:lipopolysaccharide biosynthesis protein